MPNISDSFRTLAIALLFLIGLFGWLLPMTLLLAPFGKHTEGMRHRLMWRACRFAARHLPGTKLEMKGEKEAEWQRPTVLVSNHQSSLDLLCLLMLSPRLVVVTNQRQWRNALYGAVILILFLVFHLCMNIAAVFSGEAYNVICGLLGSNWYALLGTLVLAAGVVVHFVYAIILTLQNRKARGNDRYAINARPKGVEWASQNMFVLGVIVILFMVLHFTQFWYNMMFAELAGIHGDIHPQDGAAFINFYFQGNVVNTVLYLIWFVALWFHLTHGFWSAIHTIGWNNTVWLSRWECISKWVATIICGLFAVITVIFYLNGVGA